MMSYILWNNVPWLPLTSLHSLDLSHLQTRKSIFDSFMLLSFGCTIAYIIFLMWFHLLYAYMKKIPSSLVRNSLCLPSRTSDFFFAVFATFQNCQAIDILRHILAKLSQITYSVWCGMNVSSQRSSANSCFLDDQLHNNIKCRTSRSGSQKELSRTCWWFAI